MKKIVLLLCAVLIGFSGAACSKKKPAPKGKPTVDPAKQRARALAAYQKLVTKYPESTWAPQAQERVKALTPPKK